MKTVKEILKGKNQVWFKLDKEDKLEFLQYLKHNGCVWVSGESIDINKDKCSHFMGVNKKMQVGYVSAMCWTQADQKNVQKVDFKDVLEEVYGKNCN